MSKLTKALIPGYGANPTKPNSNPLSGLAPDLETGLPQGLPSGVGKAALKFSNPVGGIGPDINGDIGYRKGWMDTSSNGTPDAPAKGPQHSIWGDPDLTKRGWGWGMDANGKLQTGVMGGGPAGSPAGPQGADGPVPQATGQAQTNLGQLGHSMAGGMQGLAGGAGGLTGFAHSLAQGMRQFNAAGGLGAQGQQGPSTAVGGPQGQYGMGGQPGAPAGAFTAPQQFPPQMPPQMPPQVPGSPAYGQNQQGTGIQALIDQLRQQQPQQSSL
jgi:hypothetical protein